MSVRALLVVLALPGAAGADDADTLARLLDDFLAGAASVAVHERFWAEDLVYTSSNGTRTTKDAILADLRAAPATAEAEGPAYRAEEVDIRVYGDTAVIAFRLVAEPGMDGAPRSDFYNTGTFRKRDGRWQAVAWQATRIPPPAPPSGD